MTGSCEREADLKSSLRPSLPKEQADWLQLHWTDTDFNCSAARLPH